MIETLRERNFALLWTAGLLSVLGDWALYAALPIFLYERTGSVFLAGMLWVVVFLPNVLVSPVAGVLVDRWDRRRVLLVANVAQMVAMLPLVLVAGEATVAVAFGVALAQASIASFTSTAESALLPTVVPEALLPSANALNVLNDNVGRIAGPLVGAIVLGWGGLGAVALLDAATFAAAALLVRLVRPGPTSTAAAVPVGGEAAGSVRRELADGVRIVRRSPVLAALFAVIALMALADGPLTAMLAPFAAESLGGGERFGPLMSIRGVAGIVGSLVVARLATRVRPERLLGAGLLVVGAQLVVMAGVADFLVACVLMVAAGPAIASLNVGITTIVQRETQDAWRGRVFSLVATTFGLLTVVGTIGGSALGAVSSPRVVVILAGLLYVVAGVLATATIVRAVDPAGDRVSSQRGPTSGA